MSSQLKACPVCSKEVAKSAKTCPHCGKKLKMGFLMKSLIFVGVLIGVSIVFSPSPQEKQDRLAEILNKIQTADVADISPTGELAEIFKLDSKHTDLQRENKREEIKGKIIQWSLPVYEVKQLRDSYRIQTSGNDAIFGGHPVVGTFIKVYARNDSETSYIESLKTGDIVTFKGKIVDVTLRNIEVEPAILILKK